MTDLVQIIWECRQLMGMDRLVMMGWAEQLEEDNDTVYASKTTVGEYIGVDERTVLRRTQALVKAGWLIETGERKQWDAGNWTPVYRINLEKFVTDCQIDRGVGDNLSGRGGCQNVIQGSGSRSSSVSPSSSQAGAEARATGLRPVRGSALPPPPFETENLKPRTNPKTKTTTSCPKCGLPWTRDKNHICPDPDFMDTPFDGEAPLRDRWAADAGGGWKPRWKYEGAQASKSEGSAASQNTVESTVGESRATLTTFSQSPRRGAPPLVEDFDCEGCFQEPGQPHHKNCTLMR
jgi:hypothetical protein